MQPKRCGKYIENERDILFSFSYLLYVWKTGRIVWTPAAVLLEVGQMFPLS